MARAQLFLCWMFECNGYDFIQLHVTADVKAQLAQTSSLTHSQVYNLLYTQSLNLTHTYTILTTLHSLT